MFKAEWFRLIAVILMALVASVRIYFFRATGTSRDSTVEEGQLLLGLRRLFGVAGFSAVAVHLVQPNWMWWATLHLPASVRWGGVGLGTLGLALLVWVHRTLGRNFSHTLTIRQQHRLVTHGPYRWVRHPMYTAFVSLILAISLLLDDLFVGVTGLLALSVVMILRVRTEEEPPRLLRGPILQIFEVIVPRPNAIGLYAQPHLHGLRRQGRGSFHLSRSGL